MSRVRDYCADDTLGPDKQCQCQSTDYLADDTLSPDKQCQCRSTDY